MKFLLKVITIALLVSAVIFPGSCSRVKEPVTSGITGDELSQQNINVDDQRSSHEEFGLLGIYELEIEPSNSTVNLIAKRTGDIGESFTVSGMSFFATFPCKDCFTINGIGYDNGNVVLNFKIKHPFPKGNLSLPPSGRNRLDLDLFDVALVFFPESKEPIHFDDLNMDVYNDAISNPDGYTNELSSLLENPALLPYVLIVDDSEANPPSSTYNKFEMGSTKEFEVKFPMSGDESLTFDLLLTFAYGASATLAERLDPRYFNPEFNRKSAWKVEVMPPNGADPPAVGNTWDDIDNATPYNVTIKVYDWQIGANINPNLDNPDDIRENSDVFYVGVLIPGMNSSLPNVMGYAFEHGGTGMPDNPLIFKVPINNENLLNAGEYLSIVKIADTREPNPPSDGYDYLVDSPDGILLNQYQIPEYATYQVFTATVAHVENLSNPVDATPPWLNFTPKNVFIDGNYAYVAGGVNGLVIFDITNPVVPVWVNSIDTPDMALGVYVSSGYAYVADGDSGLQIIDIDPLESSYIVNSVDTPGYAEGIYVSGIYAYVADAFSGLEIINIDPPESAYIVNTVDTPGYAWGVYASGSYAYIADDFYGLKIIIIDPPETARIVKTVSAKGACAAYVDNGYAYVAGNGFWVIDIDPPATARVVKSVDELSDTREVYVSGIYAYVADYQAGLQIIDIDPPNAANIVNSVDTPGYTSGVYLSGGYAYMTDDYFGLQIIDIDPLESAYIVNSVETPGYTRGVHVSGGYACVADRDAGLQIIDIDPLESTYIVKSVDTPGLAQGVYVSDGYAYVADNHYGLQIINMDPPESASIVNSVDTPGYALGVYVSGGYAYVADGYYGLQIIDIDPLESASIVNSVDTPGNPVGIYVSGGYAYLADGDFGLQIIDIDPPNSAYIYKSVDTPGSAHGVCLIGGYACVADGDSGIQIIDIDPLASAYIINSVDTPGSANAVYVSGGYACVADGDSGLQIIDIVPPETSAIVGSVDTPVDAYGVYASGAYVYVADNSGGLRIIKLW